MCPKFGGQLRDRDASLPLMCLPLAHITIVPPVYTSHGAKPRLVPARLERKERK